MTLRRFKSLTEPFMNSLLAVNQSCSSTYFVMRQISCWKCNTSHEGSLTCDNCQATQDPSKINYFELFRFEPVYDIDQTKIVSTFHQLQKQFHPDKHSNESKEAQEMSQNFSTLVNKAYKTLIHPIDRGIYILKLNNIPSTVTSVEDPELLSDVLEISDRISRTVGKNLEKLRRRLLDELKSSKSELSKAFDCKNYDEARKIIMKLKYYQNLKEKLDVEIANTRS